MPTEVHPAGGRPSAAHPATSARRKLLISLVAGVIGAVAAGLAGAGRMAPLTGWDLLAFGYGGWVWLEVWRLDPASTEAYARREDPNRDVADLMLLCAAIASIIAVGVVLFGANSARGDLKYAQAAFGVFSVFVSWALVHTVYMLKYARLYYGGTPGGIDFNDKEAPDYHDFAYLAFTIGMTFQVSDTDLQAKQIRRTALRQGWIAFPLVAVILAATINLVSGLAK